jgi:hypothetical protein
MWRCGVALPFLLCTGTLQAQEMWLGQTGARTLGLELLRPGLTAGASGVAAFATLRWPFGAYERVVAEASVAHFDRPARSEDPYAYYPFASSGTSAGNPYLGVEIGGPDAEWVGEIGVRFPAASNGSAALVAGLNSDIERADAFAGSVFSVSGYENLRLRVASGLSLRSRVGAGLVLGAPAIYDTRGLWLGYAAQVAYDRGRLNLRAGVSGRVHETTMTRLVLSAAIPMGGLRPGLSLRVPLDAGFGEVRSAVLGLTLGIEFRGRRSR